MVLKHGYRHSIFPVCNSPCSAPIPIRRFVAVKDSSHSWILLRRESTGAH
jgi:hypothetical protein